MISHLLQNLQSHGALSPAERSAVAALVTGPARPIRPGTEIVCKGSQPGRCVLLVKGQALRFRMLDDGRRQIMSYPVPGDILDLQGVFMEMDHGVAALTACEVTHISHAAVERTMHDHPGVARALWRMAFTESAIFREWMVGMGRRTARARIAHLFCEQVLRLSAVGLLNRNRVPLPLTQQHLSDSLGLSVVHTNRVLQSLRKEGVISFRGGQLIVIDWEGLKKAGEFDPAYLHMDEALTRLEALATPTPDRVLRMATA